MPTPKKNQSKEDWMAMCMGSPEERKTFPDQKQRAAVCFSKWTNRNKKKGKGSASIPDSYIPDPEFIKRFLEEYPQYIEEFEVENDTET
jgi:hypothetical protein